MNDEQFSTMLGVAIVPQVVNMIVEKQNVDAIEAANLFYNSQTYRYLSDEATKVWHLSPLTLYAMWKGEKETGEVVFPEEGL